MSRDELERLAVMVDQGLEMDRATVKRLVAHALGPRRIHVPGCAFSRGEKCTDVACAPAPTPEPRASVDEQFEAGHA